MVNDVVIKNADMKICPETDVVLFENEPVRFVEFEYFMMNKPQGVISATKDKNYSGALPRELVEKVISYYSFVNDVVLDPFGGIGTTAMAAASLKRRFVAIESEDDCVETMRTELDNLPDMFNYFEYEYKDYSGLE